MQQIGKVGTAWRKLAQLPRLASATPSACETPFPLPPPQLSPTSPSSPRGFLTPLPPPNALQVSTTFSSAGTSISVSPLWDIVPHSHSPSALALCLPSYPWGCSFLNCKKLKVTLWWGLKCHSWGSGRKLYTHSCPILAFLPANLPTH